MTIYLDCNATTPIDSRVAESVVKYMTDEFGNAGSRTHEFGARAKKAVQKARGQVAKVIGCDSAKGEVIFTSGATEANNLAILGLEAHAEETGQKHIVTTQIEHKAVLEPVEKLKERGFEVDFVAPNEDGRVEAAHIKEVLRDDTLLVSIMQVNNETGIRQPIGAVADLLGERDTYFHVDAAQGFGKEIEPLQHERIDLVSISAHKVYGPKGIGALAMRRRNYRLPLLEALMFGGGQERKLRPGTLPVQLVVGLGKAAQLALAECDARRKSCMAFRRQALEALEPLKPRFNGDQDHCLPHVLNIAFEGVDQEALVVAFRGIAAISNGSACTSSEDKRHSHVLKAMNVPDWVLDGAVRLSWCHETEEPDWAKVVEKVEYLRR